MSLLSSFREEKFADGKPESWTDLLWPQPKLVRICIEMAPFTYPKDNRYKSFGLSINIVEDDLDSRSTLTIRRMVVLVG